VKHFFTTLLLFAFILNCRAQATIEQKGKLYNKLTEKYYVLADSPEVKHGLYQVNYNKTIPVVSGAYTRGKKTGVWHFYDQTGKLLQHYNYDTNTLAYEAPEGATSAIRYVIDGDFLPTDTAKKPIKAGGIFYGYLPYLRLFAVPDDLRQADNYVPFNVTLELLVSPGGKLADFKIHINSELYRYDKVANMPLDALSEEDKTFIPATLNKKPVPIVIFIQCSINNNRTLDYKLRQ
jgi:hypothetical protein